VFKKLLFIAFSIVGGFALAQVPTANIVVPSNTICTGQTVIFSSITTNTPTSFSWTVNPSIEVAYLSSTNQPTTALGFTYPGVYTVSLTVANAAGSFTAAQSVTISATPRASFSASLNTVGFPNQIVLTNFSSNATSYAWLFSDTPTVDTNTNTTHDYTSSGAYTVSLVAYNSNGCSDTSDYSFFISDTSGITLPNVFTPNADGVNDVFKPIARGIKTMKVSIYSRYGNLVANWETINGHWDGYTPSGILCESGTYFCVVEATGFDGKDYKLKGYISLFRN